MKVFVLSALLFVSNPLRAQFSFEIPVRFGYQPGKDIGGYYNSYLNSIVIDLQTADGISHLLYDTSFRLLGQYDVVTDRRLSRKAGNPVLLRSLCFPTATVEAYDQGDSILLFQLDYKEKKDSCIKRISAPGRNTSKNLVAILPVTNGCNFLYYLPQHNETLLYKWSYEGNKVDTLSFTFPDNILTPEEIKEKGDFINIKPDKLYQHLSVSHTSKPDLFQVTRAGQLFYNDTVMYLVHRIPYSLGTHIYQIDQRTGTLVSKNYFINKFQHEANIKYPYATIYDSLLIVRNGSPDELAYYFFNMKTGLLLTQYEAGRKKMGTLVHSPIHQIGGYWSRNQENELNKRRAGMSFGDLFKPVLQGDSLVLTSGSIMRTNGIEGDLLGIATLGISGLAGIGVALGDAVFIPYLTVSRNILYYAHSKFSLKDLRPSVSSSVTTVLDDLVNDERLADLNKSNSIMIDLGNAVLLCIYKTKTGKFEVARYQQHP